MNMQLSQDGKRFYISFSEDEFYIAVQILQQFDTADDESLDTIISLIDRLSIPSKPGLHLVVDNDTPES